MSKSDIIARAVKQTQSYEEFTKVLADEYNNRFKEDSITKVSISPRMKGSEFVCVSDKILIDMLFILSI